MSEADVDRQWEIARKRTTLVNARTIDYRGFDAVYWRVAQLLEDPSVRDVTTAQFLQKYLQKFPADTTKGAIAEAVRRYRADLQNIVAPDLFPHSEGWRRKSEAHQEASKEFYDHQKDEARRQEVQPPNPFEGVLVIGPTEAKLTKWVERDAFDDVNGRLKKMGYHYAGSGVWKRD